jgi:hypothetical protein
VSAKRRATLPDVEQQQSLLLDNKVCNWTLNFATGKTLFWYIQTGDSSKVSIKVEIAIELQI